jgi:hypothetical protein
VGEGVVEDDEGADRDRDTRRAPENVVDDPDLLPKLDGVDTIFTDDLVNFVGVLVLPEQEVLEPACWTACDEHGLANAEHSEGPFTLANPGTSIVANSGHFDRHTE